MHCCFQLWSGNWKYVFWWEKILMSITLRENKSIENILFLAITWKADPK